MRPFVQRRTPCQPFLPISRSPVDLATRMASRCRWAHIFSYPYSDSGLRRPFSSGLIAAGQDLRDRGIP